MGSVRSITAARLEELFTRHRSRHDTEILIRFLSSNFGIREALASSILSGSADLDFESRRRMQDVIDRRLAGPAGQEAVELFGWNGVSKCLRAEFFGPREEWNEELANKLIAHAKAEKSESAPVEKPRPRAQPKPQPASASAPQPKPKPRPKPEPKPAPAAPAPTFAPPVEMSEAARALEDRFPTCLSKETALRTWYSAHGLAGIQFSPDVAAFCLGKAAQVDPEAVSRWVSRNERLDRSTAEKLLEVFG